MQRWLSVKRSQADESIVGVVKTKDVVDVFLVGVVGIAVERFSVVE